MSTPFAALVVLGQVTAVLILTLLFARLFARRNAALNIAVNLWGLSAALACPAIFAIVAAANVSWVTLPAPAVPEPLEIVAPSEPVAAPEPPAVAPAPAAPVTVRTDTPAAFEASVTLSEPLSPPTSAPTPPPSPNVTLPDAGALLAALWAAGALFLILRLLHGWRVQARLRSTLTPAAIDLSGVRELMGLRVAPPVMVSPNVGTPCSIGLVRPVLVLPEPMLSTLTPEAIRDILIHECAHVLHRHHWVGLLQRIAAIVFWPHPLVHVVNRDLSRRLEELCDNHVLESREAASYARTLLEVLEKTGAVAPVTAGVGLLPPRWKISDRIAGLLDQRRRIVTRTRVSAALGIGTLLAAAGVALAGIRTAEPAAAPLPEPAPAQALPDEPLPPGAALRFGSTRFRHAAGIQMLSFSPDGKTLVAGGNYAVTAWELPTGKVRFRRGSCTGYVSFSPDGGVLALGGGGNSVLLWNVATGEEIPKEGLGKTPTDHQGLGGMRLVDFSRDGKRIYSSSQLGTVLVFDAATGKELRAVKGPEKSYVTAMTVVDGKPAAISRDGDRKRVLWDLETGAELFKFADVDGYVRDSIASPDGTSVVFTTLKKDGAGGWAYLAEIWDLGLKKRTVALDDTISVAFSRDGATIATGDARASKIQLREASTGKVLRTIEMTRGVAGFLAFSHDGKMLASSGTLGVRLWDVATGKELPASTGHDAAISALVYSPDGTLLATSSSPSSTMQGVFPGVPVDPIRLWDAATGREVRAFDVQAPADALAFSPDGKRLAAAGGEHVGLWDVTTSKQLLSHQGQKEVLRTERGRVPFTSVAFSPDGATLAAGGKDGTLIFWKAATGEKIRSLDGEPITSLAYSPDGKLLALGLTDHTVRLRDASGAREIRNIAIPRNNNGSSSNGSMPTPSMIRVVFSPDGRVLATEYSGGYGNRASLWEVATGKEILKWSQGHNLDPVSMSFSPDGLTLASSTMYGGAEISLWDATSTRKITGIHASPGEAPRGMLHRMIFRYGFALAFTPDGKGIAVGTDDSTVLVWSVDPSRWPVYIRPRKEERPMEQLWIELASKDAAAAHKAVLECVRQGDRAVAFLKSELSPAGADAAAVRKLIADLDHEQAETRQSASTQLKAMDSAAEPLLRESLAANPSGELRARLAELLDFCESPMTDLPDALRTRRAVWVLERIGTPEAGSVLAALAQGPAGRLSRDARASLLRLKKK
jgi:WD40 repeat protein/beta-lactamase regulating signal transducer with metallopeptidase domain